MFYVTRTTKPSYLTDESSEGAQAIATATTLLADSSKGLTFDEPTHTYTFHGKQIPCVSDIVEFFAPFDSKWMATLCAKNPKHKLYGKSAEEIMNIWEEKRDKAAKEGTEIHRFGEACFNYLRWKDDELDEEFRARITPFGLMAATPKEVAVAKWWQNLELERYVPVAKETRIVNPVLGYAGTFDLLLYDLANHVYLLKDYKTNEELFKAYGKLKAPLSVLESSSHGKYTVQQNLYCLQLTNIGIDVNGIDLIWLKSDGNAQEVNIGNYMELVSYAITQKNLNKLN